MKGPGRSNSAMQELCEGLPPGAKCISRGHPSQGGVPFVTVHATEDELRLILQTHKAIIKSVEPNSMMTFIPEVKSSRAVQKSAPSWGLDRIDDREGLDNSY